jgi:hypothetical protein
MINHDFRKKRNKFHDFLSGNKFDIDFLLD